MTRLRMFTRPPLYQRLRESGCVQAPTLLRRQASLPHYESVLRHLVEKVARVALGAPRVLEVGFPELLGAPNLRTRARVVTWALMCAATPARRHIARTYAQIALTHRCYTTQAKCSC